MGLILLEAFGAGLLLVLIVWWTMFSGRTGGDLPHASEPPPAPTDEPEAPPTDKTL